MGSRRTSGGSNHLRFKETAPERGNLLPRYIVYNDQFNEQIGIIHWRGGWRQYVWRALPNVDMSRSCNNEINKFIDKVMKKWRESKKKER